MLILFGWLEGCPAFSLTPLHAFSSILASCRYCKFLLTIHFGMLRKTLLPLTLTFQMLDHNPCGLYASGSLISFTERRLRHE